MSPGKLGIFANLALVASAMLIPPSMTAEELGDDVAMEGLVVNPFRRTITLDCPGCPFASLEGDSYQWTPDVGNTFRLEIAVADETHLNIDNVQLFPPTFSLDTFYLGQIHPASEESLRLRVTSFQFRYDGAETVSETGTELLPMKLQIASVENVPVNLPELTINLLKDTEGRLMIASFDTGRRGEEVLPTDESKECNEWPLLCKWKSLLADRIAKLKKTGKGCHKRPHGHGYPPMMEEAVEGQAPHRPHAGNPPHGPYHGPHHGPHHMGHGHHGHGRLPSFFRRAFFTVLIPVVIGIFAGTVTYLLGMALGCLMAITMAKMRGQAYQRIALEDEVNGGEEGEEGSEKEAYAELPAYEAPPVYDEAGEKACVDSK